MKLCLFLVIISVTTESLYADDNATKIEALEHAKEAEETAEELLTGLLSVNEEYNKLQVTLAETKNQLAIENNISRESLTKIHDMQVILDKEKEFIDLLTIEHKKYNENVNKYIYENSAKKYLPFLYSLALMLNSPDDKIDDLIMRLFAGYGAGVLIEESGYGLTSLSSWMIYGSWKF